VTTVQAVTLLIAAAGLGAAIHGEMLGRRTLRWQQERDLERSTANIRIEFEHALTTIPPMTSRVAPPSGVVDRYYRLAVSVANCGEAPEYLDSFRLDNATGSGGVELAAYSGRDLKIEPHALLRFEVDVDKLPRSPSGYVGVARLARGGAAIVSPLEPLNENVREAADRGANTLD
jgi:hypothetical protein